MRTEIRFAGFGGQGIILASVIFGEAAVSEGKKAVQTQSYGPESRGGAARSEVVIADGVIDYPSVIEADYFIALSQPAYDKFRDELKQGATLIVDKDLVDVGENPRAGVICRLPFAQTANDLGASIVTNIVMLGALCSITKIVSPKVLLDAVRSHVPERFIEINTEAFTRGCRFGLDAAGSSSEEAAAEIDRLSSETTAQVETTTASRQEKVDSERKALARRALTRFRHKHQLAQSFTEDDFDRVRRVLGKKIQFVQGDVAIGFGALLAGCQFFAGYPITPATEVAEILAHIMPKIGGAYVQMEDEIGAIGAVIGASWAGSKSMTATSGPGFSLMQENIGYAAMTETPCVIVDVQRSGPSTGQPTEGAQGDVMQAKWGSHGDYEPLVLSPSTVQECLDMTIRAFNLAEMYRVPVMVLTDGIVGHMREMIELPDYDDLNLEWRKPPSRSRDQFEPFSSETGDVPEMAIFGTGFKTYITGLTHVESGYPSTDDQENHHRLVKRLCDKIRNQRDNITHVEEDFQEDGQGGSTGIISYGVTSRPVRHAVKALRESGHVIQHLRIITNWPFPESDVARFSTMVDRIIMPELNMGQVYHSVKEAVEGRCDIIPMWKTGGVMHTPGEIIEAINGGQG